ncbi:YlxM family DNA-binding protein [Fusobacterium sp.]|uniref:YlxM family DNA-binding protein n=1 Tax=Fusobacterium sp. TaxID=68766 RepID=UPI00260D330D|nr:sigma factor-like helix-turn-helix DNA-binding protein [Fusobacterium sp.]
MELTEMIEIGILLDYYKPLLTEKQKKYLLDYFEEDLSLTEIAEMNNVSRQAVYDNIKRGCKILRDYEEKLNFYKKDRKLYSELVELRKNFKKENLDKIIEKMS